MKKFKFNLQRLLRIREHEEQKWEIKLGKAVSECVRLENGINRRKAEISRMIKAGGQAENREDTLLSMEMYKRRMVEEIQKLGRELEEAEKTRDSVRETFLEVSKNRKVLSKLREKREVEYYKEQKKIEFNEIDEINNGRVPGRALV
jgi:flagellar FliJ protein